MTTLHSLRYKQILLFNDSEQGQYASNALKGFIYYLRSTGKKGVIDFSFSASKDSVHSALSIKENLILEAIPTSLIKDKEDNLYDRIKNLENKELIKLLQHLESFERKVESLNAYEVKLTSIVKALLSSSEFIFLDCPDQDISAEQLEMVKKCLLFETDAHGRKVFIKAHNPEVWLDLATDIVVKNKSHTYDKIKNPLYKEQKPALRRTYHESSFFKKAG